MQKICILAFNLTMKLPFFILLFLTSFYSVFAQQDEALANQYMQNNEYEKAADLYENLLDKNPSSPYYYENLLTCYFLTQNYDKAKSVAKTQSKRFRNNFYYQVDIGFCEAKQGDEKSTKKTYQKLIKDIDENENQTISLVNAFLKRDEYTYAIESIQKGREKMSNNLFFSEELAAIYFKMNEKEKMADEYMRLLDADSYYETAVKDALIAKIKEDKDWDIIIKKLMTEAQSNNAKPQFSNVLRWIFIQKKQFNTALIYYKAADRKYKAQGRLVLEIAEIASTNEAYDVAIEAYQYIINLGTENGLYYQARYLLTSVYYAQLNFEVYPTDTAINNTIIAYKTLFSEFGIGPQLAENMYELSMVYLIYKKDAQKSLELLEQILKIQQLNRTLYFKTKLACGDAQLALGNIWEAQLLYAQVDKDLKDEPLGQEAKLKSAKISFYIGEFDFAQSQLDVLKTATAHLISNDAIELSLLIQENNEDEEFDSALFLYAQADLLMNRFLYEDALKELEKIEILYPYHPLADDIIFMKARIYKNQNKPEEAIQAYTEVFTKYNFDIWADNALFELAELYEKQLKNSEKAKALYEKIILEKQESVFAAEARKRFRILRGDTIILEQP